MRKITREAVEAFNNNLPFNKGNTVVFVSEMQTTLRLHGSSIARKREGKLEINPCGFLTNTTKERLNGLPNVNISQKNFIWYLNGVELTSDSWTLVE
jgi:uncharacterized protein YneR